MALRSDIFQRNSLSGVTTVRNGFANVTLDIGPYGLAGNLNFIVELRRGSITGEVIAATDPISLIDFSSFISLTPNVTTISEGQDVNFTLLTANVPDGATFFYTANAVVGNITGEDFVSGLSGNVKVYNNIANILITANSVATIDIETGETFDLQLRLGSISGQVYTTTEVIEIVDTANLVNVTLVTASNTSVTETQSISFIIDTTNALGTNSQVLYYTVSGNADIYSGKSGSLLVGGNQANLELIADASVLPGEVRQFALDFRIGSIDGPIIYSTSNITVNDIFGTDAVPLISSVTNVSTSANTYYGDQTITLQITTANVVTDETLYYSVNNTSNLQVVGGNTGVFTITSNNYAEVPVTLDISGWSNISMQIRRNSGEGAILNESENVTIEERSIAGGTITEDELYITHVFTTSGNLILSTALQDPVIANVLLVGGGGGPAFIPSPSHPAFTAGGGGGGGFLEKEVIFYAGNTYTIVVGAGGFTSLKGGDTEAFGNVAYGGGGSKIGLSNNPINYGRGGSGGGAGGPHAFPSPARPGGVGIQPTYGGFGNPGSPLPAPVTFPTAAGGGGGAGYAGGGPTSSYYVGGEGKVSPLAPPLYGTPGPTPGQWFSGGGGGYDNSPTLSRSVGGAGGGGVGNRPTPGPERAGAQNTGGGAGASAVGPFASASISAGGSGIVIIKYPK